MRLDGRYGVAGHPAVVVSFAVAVLLLTIAPFIAIALHAASRRPEVAPSTRTVTVTVTVPIPAPPPGDTGDWQGEM